MNSISSFSGVASGIQWADLVDQMMNLESARKLTPIQTQVSAQQGRRIAWTTYESLLNKLKSAAAPLRDRSAFSVLQAAAGTTASGKNVVSASASASAVPGSYSVEVIELARAEKVSGAAFGGTTDQLGISGEFFVNGRRVEIAATDTLTSVRDKINAVNTGTNASGVSASILSTSPTEHRIVLTAGHTGARGIELVDGSAGALQALGVVTGATTANLAPGDSSRTQSQRFSSTTGSLASMLGVTAPPAVTTVMIDGQKVEVDLENDTILSLMTKVQSAGGTAEIVEESAGGKTLYRLSVEGAVTADATATDPVASQRLVELIGFEKSNAAETITAGRDAVFRIDGFTMSRRTNMVSDAIGGVTLNLLAANSAERTTAVSGAGLAIANDPRTIDAGTYAIALTETAGTITGATINGVAAEWDQANGTIRGAVGSDFEGLELSYSGPAVSGQIGTLTVTGDIAATIEITRNLKATVEKVEAFAAAYNELAAFVDKQRQPESSLYANGALRSMQRSLTSVLLTSVEGLAADNPYHRPVLTGVALSDKGQLTVDAAKLKAALETNLVDVEALFGTGGTATDGRVTFIGGSAKTQPGGYAIDITSPATQATTLGAALAGGTYSASDGVSDLLTITDSFSGKTADFTVTEGMTLAQIQSGIANLFGNETMALTATVEGGALRITTKDYGSNVTFEIAGTAAAGLGLATGVHAGTDVAGTIGGLPATGAGRLLTGAQGEETEGLSIRYTGSTSGAAGNINYVLGVSGMIDQLLDQMTRAGDGIIATQVAAIDSSIATLNRRASDVEARLALRRETLTLQFVRMEQAVSAMNSQSMWLSGQINAMNAANR